MMHVRPRGWRALLDVIGSSTSGGLEPEVQRLVLACTPQTAQTASYADVIALDAEISLSRARTHLNALVAAGDVLALGVPARYCASAQGGQRARREAKRRV